MALLAAGAYFVLFMNGDSTKEAAAGGGAGNDEEANAADLAEAAQRAKEALTNLEVPGNIPEIVFYFGSQTGTAEKFCG